MSAFDKVVISINPYRNPQYYGLVSFEILDILAFQGVVPTNNSEVVGLNSKIVLFCREKDDLPLRNHPQNTF